MDTEKFKIGWLLVEKLDNGQKSRRRLLSLGFRVEKRGNLFKLPGQKKPDGQPEILADIPGLSCRWYWMPRAAFERHAGTKHNL